MNWLRRHTFFLQQHAALALALLSVLVLGGLQLAALSTTEARPASPLPVLRIAALLLFVVVVIAGSLALARRAQRRLLERLDRLRQLARSHLEHAGSSQADGATAVLGPDESQEAHAFDVFAEAEAAHAAAQQQLETLRLSAWQNSEKLAQSAGRMMTALEQVVQIAKQPVDQTAISIETTSSNAIVLAERAKEAHEFTDSARMHAEQGVRVVEAAGREIQRVSQVVGQSAQTLSALSEKTASISSIVSVIKDVADQTKVLSLNAAIEAARAGKHGGGFSAVADAVRRLAERTAASTRQVSAIIEGIEQETGRAVSTMQQALQGVASSLALSQQAGQVLEQIHSGAMRSESTVRGIANATAELSSASLNLATQISTLAQGVRKGNRLAQRAASEAQELVTGLSGLRQQLAPTPGPTPDSPPDSAPGPTTREPEKPPAH